ncbi:hypothetical protein IHN63_00620 [Deinococcus sp. 6YEL10]|uniref:hypothetical protein n=1 Tax=Deinococcus sp. 6YEL10 TaxID=2745870 RepID=UPI001E4FB0AB|nr:hypothetical protein [Deinococcus sp. 6YEL10]MCD0159803.1 hypothetical protein [Deinococcus sp. 6YEL10]
MSDTGNTPRDPVLSAAAARRARVEQANQPEQPAPAPVTPAPTAPALTTPLEQQDILNLNVGQVQAALPWSAPTGVQRQINVTADEDLSLMIDDIVYTLSRRYRGASKRQVVDALLRYVLKNDGRTNAALKDLIK